MPLYEYACQHCLRIFEALSSLFEKTRDGKRHGIEFAWRIRSFVESQA